MRFAADALMTALAACLLLPGAAAQDGGRVQLLVQSSPLAGFRFHQAASVWPELRRGDELQLVREPDNPHDANALRVEWRGHVLGYVPRRENAALAWGMDRGVVLRARISRLEWHPNPARRVEFEVFVE
ncbi:MAG: HIRAN domain-containing protein [Betaproteobacteria bacterium]|nr:HIRAN domain-containing protein [Betaproteobacteria bacterium]